MSQYDWLDIDPDTESGTALAARLDAWVAAVQSMHRGASAPSYLETGMWWQKDISGTVAEVYVYDGAQSILVATINPTAHTIMFPPENFPAASDSAAGAVELSTQTEALAGTSTELAITPNALAALWEKGADNNNGATVTLGAGGSFNLITSTTAITVLAFSTDKAGRRAVVRFNTVRTLTYNASSLILPGAANITTAPGDIAEIESLGSGAFRVNWYTRAAERPLKTGTAAHDVVRLDASAKLPALDGSQLVNLNIPPAIQHASYQAQYAAGQNGPVLTVGAWTTAELNTEVSDPDGIGTLASNQVTLGAGSYIIDAVMPFFWNATNGLTRSRLRNITDGTTLLRGTTILQSSVATSGGYSFVKGRITLADTKAIALQYHSAVAGWLGWGSPGMGDTEAFSFLGITKIA